MNTKSVGFLGLSVIFASGILCSCTSAPMAGNGRHSKAATVSVSINPRNPGPAISPDFMGLSFEVTQLLPDENGVHYFRPDNTKLINLFHTLGIKSLRVGGNTSDRNAKQLPDRADLDSFFQFARAANVKVIYCLRLHDGNAQEDADTVKYIMDHYGDLMDCFSIGQEASAYPTQKRDTRAQNERMGEGNEKYRYPQYSQDWKKFEEVITAEVPNVKFCGPNIHNNGEWAREFMDDFGKSNHVVLITEHLYAGGAGNKVTIPQIGIDRMLAGEYSPITNGFPKVYEKLYESFVPMAISNGLPYRLEEVNNYFNGGAKDVSNTFASALWGLDFSYWWATHQCSGLNFHTGDKVSAGGSLAASKYTAYLTSTNGYYVRPLGYGLKAFNLGSRGTVLPVTISNPAHVNLTAYAVRGDDNSIYLTIINKSHGATARDATVIPKGVKIDDAQAISLAVPGGDVAATSGEMLGGSEINADGNWNGEWMKLPTAKSGSFAVRVPAASAVIVKLSDN